MYSLSLNQVFGDGAFQDSNFLVIQKVSLLDFMATNSNTAESLLVAILITALANFKGNVTDDNGQSITDENGQSINFDNSEAFESIRMIQWLPFQFSRNNQKYINNQIIVVKYTIDATN